MERNKSINISEGSSPTPIPLPSETPLPPVINYSAVRSKILEPHCIICHNSSNPNGKIDLSNYSSVMGTLDLVVPNEPDRSQLLNVLKEKRMPPSGELAHEDINLTRQWILRGAIE